MNQPKTLRDSFIKRCLFEKNKVELIKNLMYQPKSLRDSFIETFRYPRYAIRLQKKRQIKKQKEKVHKLNENGVPSN